MKQGRSKPLTTSIPIKRLNDQRSPLHETNPIKKCNMNMNTDTSATDAVQEKYSMQN